MPTVKMPGPRRMKRADALFDLLANEDPPGWTLLEIQAGLGCGRGPARTAIADLRLILGETHTANLVWTNQGREYFYRLEGDTDGARRWQQNRMDDTVTRIRTQHAVAKSVDAGYQASPPTTKRGARNAEIAELAARGLGRLLEDIELVNRKYKANV